MDGIVACETLYPELPRIRPDAEIRYVPQWYHEFPIHTPESDRAHEFLQDAIDDLEASGVDRVTVIYHDPDALAGLQTETVPLSVYRGRDCIELHLDGPATGPGGERKNGVTYYLTRGWIDVAVDSYKVYKAYAGELETLRERFAAAKREDPKMRVSWPESEKVQNAAQRSDRMRTDPAALLRTVINGYRHVVLIDTGRLEPFHHGYAESFREFLAKVIPEDGPREVDLTVVDGQLDHLDAVLEAPEDVEAVLTVDPGTPVPEDSGFRTGLQHQ
jgi:hypothetical protein